MNSSFSMILLLLALTSSMVTTEAKFKCGEKRKDVFFFLRNIKKGKGKEKTCGWLARKEKKNKNKGLLKKVCKQRQRGPNGLLPAKRVCPSVCGRPCPPPPSFEPTSISTSTSTSEPSSAPSISSQPSIQPSIQPSLGFCIGIDACTDSSNLNASPNSCRGKAACMFANDAVVKEGSCHGETSCYRLTDSEAGPNSCSGFAACKDAAGVVVKEGSCHGEQSCNEAINLEAGPNSCRGVRSCFETSGRIGSNSCNCGPNPNLGGVGCCSFCSGTLTNVPDDACNTDENGEPVNADDFQDDGSCKYCVNGYY